MDIVNEPIELELTTHEIIANSSEVEVCANTELEISGHKNEYSIVGDALYATISSDTPPQWLTNIIDNVVNSLISQKLTDLDTAIRSINTSLLELEVAKNQYKELINIEQTIDGVVASKMETLNATVQQNSANIINLDMAKATPDEALAITIDHLNSQINNGNIHALVTELNATIANNERAAAESISSLEAVYNENESTVRDILSTSTGEYTAEANAITELSTELNDAIFGVSGLENTLRAEIFDEGARVESKFAYNSLLSIGGVAYTSGFGLVSDVSGGIGNVGSTPRPPTGTSEFWIRADKFKMVAASQSAVSKNPFTVNAATGNITFNGIVSFTNVTDVPDLGSTPQEVVDAVNAGNTTTINGGRLTTNTVSTSQLAANSVTTAKIAIGTGIINGYVQSSDFTAIGGAGFRLKSNAAGTSADPTIYGAYIRAGTLETAKYIAGSSLVESTAGGGRTGKPTYTQAVNTNAQQTAASGVIYMPSAGSGFQESRVCSRTSSTLSITATGAVFSTGTVGKVSLQRRANGGTWVTLEETETVISLSYKTATFFYVETLGSFTDADTVEYRTLLTSGSSQYLNAGIRIDIINT